MWFSSSQKTKKWRYSMDKTEKIKAIADHYGYDTQSRQCIEETGELTQAINKFWRKQLGCGNRELPNDPEEIPMFTKEYDNLIEEMADVQVMLLQMAYLLKTDIQSMADIKLNRQLERIKREWLNLNN